MINEGNKWLHTPSILLYTPRKKNTRYRFNMQGQKRHGTVLENGVTCTCREMQCKKNDCLVLMHTSGMKISDFRKRRIVLVT